MRFAMSALRSIPVRVGIVFAILLLGLWTAVRAGTFDELHRFGRITPFMARDDKPLVLYVYSESGSSRENLEYFIEKGIHHRADFVFIFNGETDATGLVPEYPNIRTITRNNTCYDLGTHGSVLKDGDLWKNYKRFILMNASIRGPFQPIWSSSCWTDVYLSKITDKVKLAGMTLNCRPRPHVQTMILATDSVGLGILLDPELALSASVDDFRGSSNDPVGLSACYAGHNQAVHGEIGTSALIRSQGYDVDVMMTSFSSEKDVETYCSGEAGELDDVLFANKYFGTNVHPYELVFAKTNRGIDNILIENLTKWHMKQERRSWELCNAP